MKYNLKLSGIEVFYGWRHPRFGTGTLPTYYQVPWPRLSKKDYQFLRYLEQNGLTRSVGAGERRGLGFFEEQTFAQTPILREEVQITKGRIHLSKARASYALSKPLLQLLQGVVLP